MVCRAVVLTALVVGAAACATSRSVAPEDLAELPAYSFAALRGVPVQVRVVDHRAGGEESEEWVSRVSADVSEALVRSGLAVDPSAPVVLEVRLNLLRSDFENRQWKGCSKLTVELLGLGSRHQTVGEYCATKSNLWGATTADDVMALSYRDALAEALSNLDSELR
jgi:hypothetical protein